MPSSYARPEQRQLISELNLVNCTMSTVAKNAASSDSGLIVKDRKWLKIIIPNAFLGNNYYYFSRVDLFAFINCLSYSLSLCVYLGGDLVNWLTTKVKGLARRRDAHAYAKQMMAHGLIKPTVNKKFSEFCYFTFDESVTCESSNEDSAFCSQTSFN